VDRLNHCTLLQLLNLELLNFQTFLSTGSNLGDRAENLRQARLRIEAEIGRIVRASSVYITQPWGVRDQPDFYNQVLEVLTTLSPLEVLAKNKAIETKMGRVKQDKWTKRLIDIDILFYEKQIIQLENLKIPHPFLQERNFVLAPMAELAPDFVHPVLQQSIWQLLLHSKDELVVKILEE